MPIPHGLSPIIHEINDDRSHNAAVFEVGSGDHDAVTGQEFPDLHPVDLTTQENVRRGKYEQFVVPDVDAAVLADDFIDVIDLFGYVFNGAFGDPFRHSQIELTVAGLILFLLGKKVQNTHGVLPKNEPIRCHERKMILPHGIHFADVLGLSL